jgi:hypothetical protein
MKAFVKSTITDIRGGRDSWRVLFILSLVSFTISVATVVLRQPF